MEFWRDEVFGQDGCQQLNKQAVSQLKISAIELDIESDYVLTSDLLMK